MDNRIICISGLAGSGKDTLGEMLARNLNPHFFTHPLKFAHPLKEMLCALLGLKMVNLGKGKDNCWDFPLFDFPRRHYETIFPQFGNRTGREMMQWFGTDVCRTADPDFHIKALELKMGDFEDCFDAPSDEKENILTIITDNRFQNELDWAKSKGAITVRIERPNIEKINHSSEDLPSELQYDYVVRNSNNLQVLEGKASTLSEYIMQDFEKKNPEEFRPILL